MNTLGEKLKKLRIRAGMTQKAFAGALNVSSSAVSKWEHNQNEPDMETLMKIAEHYSITIEELLTGQQKKKPNEGETGTSDTETDEPGNSDRGADSRSKEPGTGNTLSLRTRWLGIGIAIGCIVTVFFGMAIILARSFSREYFSYKIMEGRHAEDVNWGSVYETSVFYKGKLESKGVDKIRNDLLAQIAKGDLLVGDVEILKILCNNDVSAAEKMETTDKTVIVYVFLNNISVTNYPE